MTQEEINKFNKKCAEFLGYKIVYPDISDDNAYWEREWENEGQTFRKILDRNDLLAFHKDWNWIMKVVEAIEKIYDDFHGYFGVYINSNSCTIQGTNLRTDPDNYHPAYFSEHLGEDKKEAVVQAINQFLIWYNINKKI